ncbi:RnfH family protein [Marinobacter sp. AN1]|uniref:RnfH family protein n=1 Tax=Marinobacter sp. AN1 TaxID=2886046 RepID=UPI0022316E40|nr:RnfH family protein [Marinobacter sp. AN1]UZD66481.1 RnfH family protein [Marinobacter sp. AN1]
MRVEVAYAIPERQEIVPVEVEEGATMLEAVRRSGIAELFPGLDPEQADMGIFGKVVKSPQTHVLRAGDRVELYRPLKIDPKQARMNRARKKKDEG